MLSEYSALYDILVTKDNELRKMNELMDFSFVRKELSDKYCPDNGRTAVDPVRLFKYLLLKFLHPQSDVDLVKRSFTDMSYKYFLGMSPEEGVIDPSLLTKFRRERMKDSALLDMLIGRSVSVAIERGIIKHRSPLIVDATHTRACFKLYNPKELLARRAQALRKVCIPFCGKSLRKEHLFPGKKTETFDDTLAFCRGLADTVESSGLHQLVPGISEELNYLRETIDDVRYEAPSSKDRDARTGHKTQHSSFFGYKEHLAMTPEGIITSAVVTSGEKSDGRVLQQVIEKSGENGVEATDVIGDTAYSGKDNISYCGDNGINLVAPLNPTISNGTGRKKEFEYNKDAGMFVCPAGHMAVRKRRSKSAGNRNSKELYFFDTEKCKHCPLREGCYKDGAKQKSYTVTILSGEHKRQMEFEKSEYYKGMIKKRNSIEGKNSELKNAHGLDRAISYGIESMEMQTVMSIFVVNLKKIMKME